MELLLDNIDAERVVITADHGEAFGEYGFYWHKVACPLPIVRQVPWIETTAEDTGGYEPDGWDKSEKKNETCINERLKALGYAE
ncbi:hypothetical protein EXE46_09090 [Halorubrum sp. GN11_10-6_MGM]|nr:hypothetical protein EXE46_09090 [Halorubrum sp. GN11_10-6_MGM]